ncbi:MAG: acetyl-CoA carboxylase biotin carboxylase subunit [Alphaproteobacteria bacterium]|nr:acetyl-CoA carboxylase biotin carboxylase subunit [Alphaproteobacteria bacterium]
MFEKVLIANRGEIALRIHRACREMGIRTVAVHSEADANAMHVRLADEAVCIGPARSADSYLNKPAIISAAIITGADAIHPGYGFLSENADFAEMVEKHGITFIGPTVEQMRLMGDKITARKAAKEAGLPITEGSPELEDVESAKHWAHEIGYPVIIKAKDGGGGKGMKIAFSDDDIEEAYTMARAEAKAAFPSDIVYMEKYLQHPRHIEMQILADKYGNVVHLGERDCSIQRNNQKVIEECPSPALNQSQRDEIGEIVRKAIAKIGYCNAGTLEFLYEDGKFYFMEMNTRLQVEHPVTEAVTGIDIVREQIRIASGAQLGYTQEDIKFNGHAIECRINAEDPATFIPCPGKIEEWHAPGGLGVRVDSEIYSGYAIPPFYDSMIAKLIVHAGTRNAALMRLRRALEEFVIMGVNTTIPLHQKIISQPEYLDGQYDIHWLEHFMKSERNDNE